MIRNWISAKICHFWVKYSNSLHNCLSFIIIPLDTQIQIKVLFNDLSLLLDLFGNSEGTKLLIWTVIFCLVFTAPEKWSLELRAKTGHCRYRCLHDFTPFKPTFSGGGPPDPPPPPNNCDNNHVKIVAAFRGMHVSPAKHTCSSASVTDGRTDRRTDRQTDGQTTDKVIPKCRYASQATQKCVWVERKHWEFIF